MQFLSSQRFHEIYSFCKTLQDWRHQPQNGFSWESWILTSWAPLLSFLAFNEIFQEASLQMMLSICNCIISVDLGSPCSHISHYWMSTFISYSCFFFLSAFHLNCFPVNFSSFKGLDYRSGWFVWGGFFFLFFCVKHRLTKLVIIIAGLCIETTTRGWVSSEDGRALWMCTLHSQSSQGLSLPSSR